MRKELKYLLLVSICISFLFTGCSDLLIEAESSAKPEDVFEALWTEFDRYYPFFVDKNIDWDSVYTLYASQIDNSINEEDLFFILSDMVNILEDGHVNIYSPYGTSAYTGWYDQYPRNFNIQIVMNRYLSVTRRITGEGNILYGRIGSIGYIYVQSFTGAGGWVNSIDDVLDEFHDLNGLIIDVRHNGGGSSQDARDLVGRFTDRERIYSYIQFRNGPRHTDFTELESRRIVPQGRKQYLIQVALLTNRSTYSAAEDFVLAMKELPNVKHIGDTTGGGLGNPIHRELPNGWRYRLPVWRQFPVDLSPIEGIGISPDLQIDITQEDAQLFRDTIINEAVNYLNSQ